MVCGDGEVLYIDPSHTGTGLFYLDRPHNKMEFALIAPERRTMRTYGNYFVTANKVVEGLDSFLRTRKVTAVKMEIPPPYGQTAAGLTGLSYLLLARILRIPGLERVELINPSFVSLMQRKYFSDASERSLIADAFLERQKKTVRGVLIVRPDLLDDNDVATAYLFYVFEKVLPAEGKAFTVLPMVNGEGMLTTTTTETTEATKEGRSTPSPLSMDPAKPGRRKPSSLARTLQGGR